MQQTTPMMRNTQPQTIDITSLLRAMVRSLPAILMCAWIGLMGGFVAAGYGSAPTYQSKAYMMVRYKTMPSLVLPDQIIEKVSSQYKITFESSAMAGMVKSLAGDKNLQGKISARVPEGTNLLEVTVTSQSPMDAFEMARIAVENCEQVSDYYITDFFLEELKAPEVPMAASNRRGWKKFALLGAFLGLALSCGIVALKNLLYNDVKNETQMDRMIEADRFATLFYERKKGKNKKKGILLKFYNTDFFYMENVRKMAAKFAHQTKKSGKNVLMVTSVMENEGKSTVSSNLALALAAQNKKVLLIDADFRHPSLSKLFEKEISPQQEITRYLTGEAPLQDVLTREEVSGLYYLFGTQAFRDSDKILRPEQMKKLILSAKAEMDYVILDTSPMAASNDAEILSHLVDTAMLVVRQGCSKIPMINEAIELLRENQVDVCGCVYNAVETRILPKMKEHGYYYSYGYGYGYGYGYEKKEKARKN